MPPTRTSRNDEPRGPYRARRTGGPPGIRRPNEDLVASDLWADYGDVPHAPRPRRDMGNNPPPHMSDDPPVRMPQFRENRRLLRPEDNLVLFEIMENISRSVQRSMWRQLRQLNFEQQRRIIASSPFLAELWGNFGGTRIRIEIPIPSDPIIRVEWAVHYRQFLPPIVIPIGSDVIRTRPPYAPPEWVDPLEEAEIPNSEDPPTDPIDDVAPPDT